ncbi:hypothetical protein HMPREF1991_02458 [Hoylesella loescheii DSM 19665 = JCM 12249 = ATCC 15930]|uniref:Uncharacterized protein n=1 Tax=Hoylesella loescheii DSM 19665 = JCM 12249 = ATCC 15930 TaxID=1122985 RepID=A0A069QFF4_HOYLO|nr:hypothetical protein HMPREF1991_02458 [Hoylesella loescheii DSM 19665 = JCM 12249 = ATCC 15930]
MQCKPQYPRDYKCFDMGFIPQKAKGYEVVSAKQTICIRTIMGYLLF